MKYIYFLFISILLASCEIANEPIMENKQNVSLILTKSSDIDIYDIHILVYKDRILYEKRYAIGNKINFSLPKGKYTFYAIANTYKSNIDNIFYKPTNLNYESELNNAVIRYNVNSLDGIYSSNKSIILSGKQEIIVKNEDVFIPTFEVVRIAALVTFKLKSKLPILCYQICKINHYTYLIPRPNKNENNPNDIKVGNDYYAGWMWDSEFVYSLEGKYYLYENRSGGKKSNNVDNDNKNQNAPPNAIYINIYVQGSHTRKIYLGSNNGLNYNVKRNCKYDYIINVI